MYIALGVIGVLLAVAMVCHIVDNKLYMPYKQQVLLVTMYLRRKNAKNL